MSDFAERINPYKLGFSPKMTAIVGAIIGHDYGAKDSRGGTLTHLSISSDGYVFADSTAHDTGAFIGSVDDLERNLEVFKTAISKEDKEEFERLYSLVPRS